jgi:hypothetical protein
MNKFDKKDFENEIKNGCKITFKGKEIKECQKTMMCNLNKCRKEQQELHASKLTDEDRKTCEHKDWKKEFACQNRITKKRGHLDKLANAAHCEVNKCPEIRELNEKRIQKYKDRFKSKQSNYDGVIIECQKQHCSKQLDERDKAITNAQNAHYDCLKKFNTWKTQIKCSQPFAKKSARKHNKLHMCKEKHCKAQIKAWRSKFTKKY